ncbi:putative Fe-S protein YdhL (DUF1289 family) [Rhodoblastus acidophilus]|uniref:DUF1289 domain-containing protein n=1 Tax=Rhodoblastus acidophilus TaxID=1074 RepID=UPI002224069F|nr:DUF1289 domain-containing protein [Rhodoblastus acidophilus]MCW2282512.1 putative Fe-S protein YdhL (DUF1289 family) [Rhodoblastus acidophilus]MCW2331373.1 putative Fe-S protein YdhL (DUF1289 family) [Rhodoblastus acidophilus]
MLTSPCTGLCQIEDDFCRGCGRTREEIGGWRGAGEDFRQRVWAKLPQRRAALGIKLHRKDWSARDARDFVVASLRRGGVWSAGGLTFRAEGAEVQVNGGAIRCISSRGALGFALDESVCAFADGAGDESIILATARRRTEPSGPGRLGPDVQAVRAQDRAAILYDLGLGDAGCTYCVRATDPDLIARLEARAGDGRNVLAELSKYAAPHAVVLTGIGRIEAFGGAPPGFAGEERREISPAYVACARLLPG